MILRNDLTPDQSALLEALLDAPAACCTADELAEAAVLPLAYAQDVIKILISRQWLSSWTREDETDSAYTLTPLAASRLGVTLQEEDGTESLRWTTDAASVRPLFKRHDPRLSDQARQERFEQIPDQAPDPTHIVCAIDYLEHLLDQTWPSKAKRARETWEYIPKPTVLVGMSNPCYLPADDFARPAPDAGRGRIKHPVNAQKGRACKGCNDRPLKPYEVCTRCSRWGLDGLLHKLSREGASQKIA